MKKTLSIVLLGALVAASFAAVPAQAAKKKKKAKPVATTLFIEGSSNLGEEDQIANGTYLKLQPTAGSGEKSIGIPNYTGGPNPNCAGNALVPVFVGPVAGRVTGDIKITFDVSSTPASKVNIRVWPDVTAQACNDSYIEPAAAVDVDLPSGSGTVEAVIEDVDFVAQSAMMIQVTPVIGGAPSMGRLFYGTDTSKVEFLCTPAAGAACA